MSNWKITDGKFKDFTFSVAIPSSEKYGITDQDVNEERRLQESEKPLIDGADVEDFGRKARVFSATVCFFGDDYRDKIKDFYKILNEGTTGILILPDMEQAVNAKYKTSSRKTSVSDGSVTTFSITWVEDNNTAIPTANRAGELLTAKQNLEDGNTTEAVATTQSVASQVNGYADKSRAALNNNKFLNDARRSLASASATTTGVNGILGVPKSAREQIVALADGSAANLDEIKSGANGFLTFLDSFKQKSSTSAAAGTELAPLRFNTGLNEIDYQDTDTVTTTVISGAQTVVTTEVKETKIDSFKSAVELFKSQIIKVEENNKQLEDLSRGQTAEYRTNTIFLINTMKDLIDLIEEQPKRFVFSSIDSSLMEIMYANGTSLDQLERVHKLNRNILDIVDIPAYTLVGL